MLTYRDQYLVERDFARVHGRHVGITPLYVQMDSHALGLVRLLSVAVRTLVMIEFVARRSLETQEAELSGIYAGNPKRATARPTAEMLLATFKGITLNTIHSSVGQILHHLTPLTPVQERILGLLEMPRTIYTGLVTSR